MTYRFEPGADDDGVTVHVPVEVLARLGGDEFAWHVPALREELVTALIRSLPKDLRRNFVPAPDTARAVLADPRTGNGTAAAVTAARVAAAHRRARADRCVRPRQAAVAPAGDVRRRVRGRHRGGARQGPRGAAGATGRTGPGRPSPRRSPTGWNGAGCAAGPTTSTSCRAPSSASAAATPCAASRRSSTRASAVDIRVFATTAEQDAAMGPGIRRLLRLSVPSPVKTVERQLNPRTRLVLGANPDGSLAALLDDCADAAVAMLAPAPVWTPLRVRGAAAAGGRRRWRRRRSTSSAGSRRCSPPRMRCEVALPAQPSPTQADAIADIRAQLDRLLPHGFVTATGATHLGDLARYLTAIGRRLDRLPRGVDGRPRADGSGCTPCEDAYDELRQALSPARAAADDVRDIARHDRGAAGEPVGPTARHRAAGQRAAHLPGDRRRHTLSRCYPRRSDGESSPSMPWCAKPLQLRRMVSANDHRPGRHRASAHRPRRCASNSSGSSMQWQGPIARVAATSSPEMSRRDRHSLRHVWASRRAGMPNTRRVNAAEAARSMTAPTGPRRFSRAMRGSMATNGAPSLRV